MYKSCLHSCSALKTGETRFFPSLSFSISLSLNILCITWSVLPLFPFYPLMGCVLSGSNNAVHSCVSISLFEIARGHPLTCYLSQHTYKTVSVDDALGFCPVAFSLYDLGLPAWCIIRFHIVSLCTPCDMLECIVSTDWPVRPSSETERTEAYDWLPDAAAEPNEIWVEALGGYQSPVSE